MPGAWARADEARHGSQRPMGPTTRLFGSLAWEVTSGSHGYNADTGALVYTGGGTNELMTGTRQWNSRNRSLAAGSISGQITRFTPLSCRQRRLRLLLLLLPTRDCNGNALLLPHSATATATPPPQLPTPTAAPSPTPTATVTPTATPTPGQINRDCPALYLRALCPQSIGHVAIVN